MATKVTLSSAGVMDLMTDPGVRAYIAQIADRVADAARASAPVETGTYRDSIHRESGSSPLDGRIRETVVANAPHAHLVEARTGNLARALGSI